MEPSSSRTGEGERWRAVLSFDGRQFVSSTHYTVKDAKAEVIEAFQQDPQTRQWWECFPMSGNHKRRQDIQANQAALSFKERKVGPGGGS